MNRREAKPRRLIDSLDRRRSAGHIRHRELGGLPIGFWAGVLVADIAGQPGSALNLAVAGVVTGVATALTGVADLSLRDGRGRSVAVLHGILAVIALLTASTSVVLRLSDALPVGEILNAATLAISLTSLYLLARH
jgi:hypothetical protein